MPAPANLAQFDALLPVSVQRLAHGGLTSGYVPPKWWRATGVPFLPGRAAQLRGD